MTFTVVMANGAPTLFEGSYKVSKSGLLSIETQGGNAILLSPAGWLSLETDAPISDLDREEAGTYT
jgi:hypothetical protein